MNSSTAVAPARAEPAAMHLRSRAYTIEAMIDFIIQEPSVRPGELAELIGYSQGWVSCIINSDSFQARLAQRKAKLVDPILARSVREQFRKISIQSTDIISEKLSSEDASAAYAMEALGLSVRAMEVLDPVIAGNAARGKV